MQNVYVTSARNVDLFDKTSLLFLISSLHIILSFVNGESFLLSSLDCFVKLQWPQVFQNNSIIISGIKRERKNEAACEERNLPIQYMDSFERFCEAKLLAKETF